MDQRRPRLLLELVLGLVSLPLVLLYGSLLLATFTDTPPGSLLPTRFTLEHWRFLLFDLPGRPSIWRVTLNTLIYAAISSAVVVSVSTAAGYALARLNLPMRRFFLGSVLVMHAFPTVTLIIAIFLVLQFVGLYDTLTGVILVQAVLELPFGIWIMKGFFDQVPWDIEIAGVQDGASRLTVWWRLVLPQVRPGIVALTVFAFLAGWSSFVLPLVLAPSADVQVLSLYLSALMADEQHFDFNLFRSVGLYYILPIAILFFIFQKSLMNIYGGGSKG